MRYILPILICLPVWARQGELRYKPRFVYPTTYAPCRVLPKKRKAPNRAAIIARAKELQEKREEAEKAILWTRYQQLMKQRIDPLKDEFLAWKLKQRLIKQIPELKKLCAYQRWKQDYTPPKRKKKITPRKGDPNFVRNLLFGNVSKPYEQKKQTEEDEEE
jgi:hypothetical protein